MARFLLAFALVAVLSMPAALGHDWPFHIDFGIGFSTTVGPNRDDQSRAHGLQVIVENLVKNSANVNISGYIVNQSSVPCDGVSMSFAVESYRGIGTSFGTANVEPGSIPPGGHASFQAFISLVDPDPKTALYTITAQTPPCCLEEYPGGPTPETSTWGSLYPPSRPWTRH